MMPAPKKSKNKNMCRCRLKKNLIHSLFVYESFLKNEEQEGGKKEGGKEKGGKINDSAISLAYLPKSVYHGGTPISVCNSVYSCISNNNR